MVEKLRQTQKGRTMNLEEQNNRLNEFIDTITSIASLDFSKKVKVLGTGDLIDVAGIGINMLGEALEDTVVSKKRLEKSETRFIKLFTYAPHAMLISNGAKLVEVNEAFTEMFGYEQKEIESLNMMSLTYPGDRKKHVQLEQDLLNGKIPKFNIEKRYLTKSKEVLYCDISVSILRKEADMPNTFIIQIVDITDKKKSEEKIQKNLKKLEATNKELDRFAYVVSHDLKAPLRGIASLASFIEEDLEGTGNEDVLENFKLLKGRIGRMNNLINGILEYSKIGKVQVETETFDMNEFLASLIEMVVPETSSVVRVLNELPLITTVKIGIQQIFQNILSNAIKYNDKEKCIIDITYADRDCLHEFSITDNGPGIAKEYHEKIFGIFQTLQPRDKIESTGVGLSIVKKHVERLGGMIRVESEIGLRTTFIFTIEKNNKRQSFLNPCNEVSISEQ